MIAFSSFRLFSCRALACCILTPLVAAPAFAQAPAQVPAPDAVAPAASVSTWKPAPLFDPAAISLRALPNGVRGVVKETRGTGLVSVQVWVRAGSRFEGAHSAGAAHLLETLALRSSRDYPDALSGGGAEAALEGLSAIVSSQTARDATFYSATVAAPFLPAAMRALSDAVLRPNLSDAAVANGKIEVEDELDRRDRDPIATVADLAYRTAFARHPYKRSAFGSPEALEELQASTVRAFHRARYTGSNISVIVVGDTRRDNAHKLISQFFAPALKSGPSVRLAPERAPQAFKQVTLKRATLISTVALAWSAPGIAQPEDVVATDVLLSYWKEGSDAALRGVLLGNQADDADENAAPEESPALAVAYDVDYLTQRDPSLLIVSLLTGPAKREQAVKAVLDEAARVRESGLTEAELTRAKAALRRQYRAQDETVSGQAGALGFYEMIATYEFATSYLARVDRVTGADVQRIARQYLSPTAYVRVAVEPQTPTPRPQRDENIITASWRR